MCGHLRLVQCVQSWVLRRYAQVYYGCSVATAMHSVAAVLRSTPPTPAKYPPKAGEIAPQGKALLPPINLLTVY